MEQNNDNNNRASRSGRRVTNLFLAAILFVLAAILCVLLFGAKAVLIGFFVLAVIAVLVGMIWLIIRGLFAVARKYYAYIRRKMRDAETSAKPWPWWLEVVAPWGLLLLLIVAFTVQIRLGISHKYAIWNIYGVGFFVLCIWAWVALVREQIIKIRNAWGDAETSLWLRIFWLGFVGLCCLIYYAVLVELDLVYHHLSLDAIWNLPNSISTVLGFSPGISYKEAIWNLPNTIWKIPYARIAIWIIIVSFVVLAVEYVILTPNRRLKRSLCARRTQVAKKCISMSEERGQAGLFLKELIQAQLAEFENEDRVRVNLSGPDVTIDKRGVRKFELSFHELMTNAIKHGSLSDPNGTVAIEWETENGKLRISWREHGGPLVRKPVRTGYGSLTFQQLREGTDGDMSVEFAPAGITWKFACSLWQVGPTFYDNNDDDL